jgi:hypothetical protein
MCHFDVVRLKHRLILVVINFQVDGEVGDSKSTTGVSGTHFSGEFRKQGDWEF